MSGSAKRRCCCCGCSPCCPDCLLVKFEDYPVGAYGVLADPFIIPFLANGGDPWALTRVGDSCQFQLACFINEDIEIPTDPPITKHYTYFYLNFYVYLSSLTNKLTLAFGGGMILADDSSTYDLTIPGPSRISEADEEGCEEIVEFHPDIASTHEVQELTITGAPTGGTFTLTFGADTTAPITFSTTEAVTAFNIDAALEALTTIGAGGITSVGTPGTDTFSITFASDLGDVPELTVDVSGLTGGVGVTGDVETTHEGSDEFADALGTAWYGTDEECVENPCLEDDACDTCCPDVTCIHLVGTITKTLFTSEVIVYTYDIPMARNRFLGGAPSNCFYYGICAIPADGATPAHGMAAIAHVVCDSFGTPSLRGFWLTDYGQGPVDWYNGQWLHEIVIDTPVAFACSGDTVISEADIDQFFFPPNVETIEVDLTLTPEVECEDVEFCVAAPHPRWRQVIICGGAPIDLWATSAQALAIVSFSLDDGQCYYFDDEDSDTHGTLLDLDDIVAIYGDCDACGCPVDCIECGSGDFACTVCPTGAVLTIANWHVKPGECSVCTSDPMTGDGCGYCCACDGVCHSIGCPNGGGLGGASCPCHNVATQEECDAFAGDGYGWYCDPDCIENGFGLGGDHLSICSRKDFSGTNLALPFVNYTSNEIHFGTTLTFGSDVVVFDVWFDCDDGRWYAKITVNTVCVFEGDINGDCFSFTGIVLHGGDIGTPDHQCTDGEGIELTGGTVNYPRNCAA